MKKYNVDIENVLDKMEKLKTRENSDAAAINGQYAGIVAVADTIKETSKKAISG